ncbi:hypothetical protein THAOC_13514 [Thalassiosira oceanica]|uniref:Uncharacterized protein n=1 Tax=Thalassiosira oceanica TaxID=159749 RepID=K0SXA0_THAOC|nr:hypothetical protein THAOC_13514 [Thalassiosira oceanica]|eukprot:EJK65606.1 hypothetical protein THAOC_13514 [Thalassiosira oceanica]
MTVNERRWLAGAWKWRTLGVSMTYRTNMSMEIPEEGAETQNSIKSIIRRKKELERDTMRAAQLEQERLIANERPQSLANGDDGRRAIMKQRVQEIRSELGKLSTEQAEIEKGVQLKYMTKQREFEYKSRQDEKKELEELQRRQDLEMKELLEEHALARKADEAKCQERIKEIRRISGEKRKALGMGTEEGEIDDGTGSDNSKKTVLESDRKKEELKTITAEINELNKTKSSLVWLLKQVITVEKKAELKAKTAEENL